MNLHRAKTRSSAGHKLSLRVASCRPPGRFSPAPKSTRRQKAAVRAIENVGVFSPYIYPNQCTDASALPCGFRLACPCLSDWFYQAAIPRQKNPPAQSLLRYAGVPSRQSKLSTCPHRHRGRYAYRAEWPIFINRLSAVSQVCKELWCAAEYGTMHATQKLQNVRPAHRRNSHRRYHHRW